MTTLKYPHNIFVVTPNLKKNSCRYATGTEFIFACTISTQIVTCKFTFYVTYIIGIYDQSLYNLRGHLPTYFETSPKFEGP